MHVIYQGELGLRDIDPDELDGDDSGPKQTYVREGFGVLRWYFEDDIAFARLEKLWS